MSVELTSAGFFKNVFGKLFGFNNFMSGLNTFVFLAKVIILLILVLYAHKVLNLGRNTTLLLGVLVFLVFFSNFWIFGTLWAVAITVIAFLLIGLLGFIS